MIEYVKFKQYFKGATMISEPLISIVMPCYNAEKFIARTIKTVIYQTYKNWELIIVDDVSDDGSFKIAEEFAKNETRIKLFKLKQKGFTHGARNFATDQAEGDYIAFLDSDDLWLKNKLEVQINFMLKNNCKMSISNNYMMDFNGEIFEKPYINPEITTYDSLMIKKSAIHFSSVMYSVKDLGKHYFQEKEPEDYMFCLELLKITPQALNVNKILTVYRISNPLSNSGKKLSYARKTWKLYRSMKNINFIRACWSFLNYAVRGILRYRPYKNKNYFDDISFLNLPE